MEIFSACLRPNKAGTILVITEDNSFSISTNISGIPGMLDWEEMVSNIADGALDMSGSRRRRKEKKSTKLRLLRFSWLFDNQ